MKYDAWNLNTCEGVKISYLWHDQVKGITCRQYSILISQHKSFKMLPSEPNSISIGHLVAEIWKNSLKFKNNVKLKNLSPLLVLTQNQYSRRPTHSPWSHHIFICMQKCKLHSIVRPVTCMFEWCYMRSFVLSEITHEFSEYDELRFHLSNPIQTFPSVFGIWDDAWYLKKVGLQILIWQKNLHSSLLQSNKMHPFTFIICISNKVKLEMKSVSGSILHRSSTACFASK